MEYPIVSNLISAKIFSLQGLATSYILQLLSIIPLNQSDTLSECRTTRMITLDYVHEFGIQLNLSNKLAECMTTGAKSE